MEDRCVPANFTVNILGDTVAVNLATGQDAQGNISLHSAIQAGNASGDSNVGILFDGGLSGGTITLTQALPDLAQNFHIQGLGSGNLTIARSDAAGTAPFGIFILRGGAYSSSIDNLTIRHGFAQNSLGGGIAVLPGVALNVTAVTLTDNLADFGGAIYNLGNLSVYNCRIYENSAVDNGGAVSNLGQAWIGDGTQIVENNATRGGGIENNGQLSLANAQVYLNWSILEGGGIYNNGAFGMEGGLIQLNSSTTGNGGGLYNRNTSSLSSVLITGNDANNGGGVYNQTGTMTLNTCTFQNNSVHMGGVGTGGSWTGNAEPTRINCTMIGDTRMQNPN